ECVISAPIKRVRGKTAEVTNARKRSRDEAIKELVHTVTTKGNHCTDGHAGAQLERRDGFLGSCNHRLLASDHGQVTHGGVERTPVGYSFSQADVEHNFLKLRYLVDVCVAEFFRQRRNRILIVLLTYSCHSNLPSHPGRPRKSNPFMVFPPGLPCAASPPQHSGHHHSYLVSVPQPRCIKRLDWGWHYP